MRITIGLSFFKNDLAQSLYVNLSTIIIAYSLVIGAIISTSSSGLTRNIL